MTACATNSAAFECAGSVYVSIIIGVVLMLTAAALIYGCISFRIVRRPFQLSSPVVVHFESVRRPLRVLERELPIAWFEERVPHLAPFLVDLPTGVAIKGGVARKLTKALFDKVEGASKFDIDVEVIVDDDIPLTREFTTAVRTALAGRTIGSLILEAQDIEVSSRSNLRNYFYSRDVSQNEVLALKRREGFVTLLYSEDAERDMRADAIRPAVHALTTSFCEVWRVGRDGVPYVAGKNLTRSIIRYLKGHGNHYVFDKGTWAHYRRFGLSVTQLFQVLKPFHDDDAQFNAAVQHLIELGFLSRAELRRYGGANLLWGELLHQMNTKIARFGGRLSIGGELTPEQVELWAETKVARVARTSIVNWWQARRIGFVASSETVVSLGIYELPPSMEEYLVTGATFDLDAFSAPPSTSSPAGAPQTRLPVPTAASAAAPAPGARKTVLPAGWIECRDPHTGHSFYANPAISKATWQLPGMRTALEGRAPGGVVMRGSLAETGLPETPASGWHSLFTGKEGRGPRASSSRGPPMRAPLLDSGSREISPNSMHTSFSMVEEEVASIDEEARRRQARLQRLSASGVLARSSHDAAVGDAASAVDVSVSRRGDSTAQAKSVVQPSLFAFHATSPMDAVETGDEEEKPTLLNERQLLPLWRVVKFVLGLVSSRWLLYVPAFALLLTSTALHLYVPTLEGDAINQLLNDDEGELLRSVQPIALCAMFAVLCSLGGQLLQELAAVRVLRLFTWKLFSHLLSQDMAFFNSVSLGEILARAGNDSLTLRAVLTTINVQLVESVMLIAGSITYIGIASNSKSVGDHPLLLASVFVTTVAVLSFGFAFGVYARVANLRVRQALGRMLGFTLESFQHVHTVKTLQIEARQHTDHAVLVNDYYTKSRKLHWANALLRAVAEFGAAFTMVTVYWSTFATEDPASVSTGELVTLLHQVRLLSYAISQFVLSYARMAVALGAVERVVALHDSGTLSPTPPPDPFEYWYTSLLGAPRSASSPRVATVAPIVLQHKLTGELQFVDVSLVSSLNAHVQILHGVSLNVKPGELVVLTGSEGAAKSALLLVAQLLLRPHKGGVRFGREGRPADTTSLVHELEDDFDQIRRQVGVVAQHAAGIFRASVEANVCLGCVEPVPTAEVRAVCERVGLDSWVSELSAGYQTLIGDSSGITFSPGQLNQIMLARALLRRPKLLFIDVSELSLSPTDTELFISAMQEDQALRGMATLAATESAALRRAAAREVRIEGGTTA